MKRSIRDQKSRPNQAAQGRPGMQDQEALLKQVPPEKLGEMQDAVSQLSGKSQNELMQELRQCRAAGVFDDKALADVAARLAPMLTPEQQKRLFSVMREL